MEVHLEPSVPSTGLGVNRSDALPPRDCALTIELSADKALRSGGLYRLGRDQTLLFRPSHSSVGEDLPFGRDIGVSKARGAVGDADIPVLPQHNKPSLPAGPLC